MNSALAVILLLGVGLPLGFAVAREVPLALVLAPLVSGVCATVAVCAMVVVGGPLWLWLVLAVLAQWSAAGLVLWRWRRPVRPAAGWGEALCLLVPMVPPFLLVVARPDGWDANSIWWLHAGYFSHGGEFARQAIGAPALNFAHPDYPPLASATIAAEWLVSGRYVLQVAHVITAVLTFAAIGALVYAVRKVTGSIPTAVSVLIAIGVGLATWYTSPLAVVSGQVDALAAATLAGAAVLLLVAPDPVRQLKLAVLLMSVAALTKNEGFIACGILAVLATLRARRQLARIWPVWVPVAAGLCWLVLVRRLGAHPDVVVRVHPSDLWHADSRLRTRLGPTLHALRQHVGTLAAGTAVIMLLGCLGLRDRRRRLGINPDGWLAAMAALYGLVLIMVYATSNAGIDWYLSTSADRTSSLLALLGCTIIGCWAAVAVGPGGGRPDPVLPTAESDAPGPEPVPAQPGGASDRPG